MLKLGSAAAMAELAALGLDGCGLAKTISSTLSGCAKITDIEHVVIFTHETRSFDHYFGSYPLGSNKAIISSSIAKLNCRVELERSSRLAHKVRGI